MIMHYEIKFKATAVNEEEDLEDKENEENPSFFFSLSPGYHQNNFNKQNHSIKHLFFLVQKDPQLSHHTNSYSDTILLTKRPHTNAHK